MNASVMKILQIAASRRAKREAAGNKESQIFRQLSREHREKQYGMLGFKAVSGTIIL